MGRRTYVGLVAGLGLAFALALGGVLDIGGPASAAAAPVASVRAAGADESVPDVKSFAKQFENLFEKTAADVSPAVVMVMSQRMVVRQAPRRPDFGQQFGMPFPQMPQTRRQYKQKQQGLGSGCILDADGNILTNNHVVADAQDLKVRLADGREFAAKLVGGDDKTDLAVIKISEPVKNLPTVKLGDSDTLRVGEWVMAVGNPFGFGGSVSAGIVSALGRTGIGSADYESLIQTDAAINPGNSGGPLVNLDGEVIGINASIFSPTGGNLGIGFAIPINMARDILPDMVAGRAIVRGYLGVRMSDVTPELADQFKFEGTEGALIHEVTKGSPADEAGIEAGDIVMQYNGQAVRSSNEFQRKVTATKPDTKVKITVWRDAEQKTLTVKVGNLASVLEETAEASQNWLGLTVQPLTEEMASSMGRPGLQGLIVAEVSEDSPAAEAISVGDVVLSINRQKVESVNAYTVLVSQVKPGQQMLIRTLRASSGQTQFFVVRRPRQ